MVTLKSQSELIQEAKNMLRPYQREVFQRCVTEHRHLNYMDMGMGKGLVTLLSVFEQQAFPCIIICNKAATGVLETELLKWFNEESVVYGGKPKDRDLQWYKFVEEGHRFIITNYAMAEEIGARFGLITSNKLGGSGKSGNLTKKIPTPPGTPTKWNVKALIADEIHTAGLFNHKSKTYGIFKILAKAIPNVYLLTGTPFRRGIVDFYGPLSLIDPVKFKSYWGYVNTYGITIDSGFGKGIERNPRDAVQFRAMLRQYASVMAKKDHLKDMPPKIRQTVPIPMDPEQQRVYEELSDELFADVDSGEMIMVQGKLQLLIRQRQLLACPQELGLGTRGAAIDTMLDMAKDLVEDRKPFVIFTPFRKAVPWIKLALKEEFGAVKIHEITGGLTANEFTEQWKSFQEGRGCRVLICVIKSGAAFHATAADTAFFIGYEYDFNQNAQAEDRLYRIGQEKAVNCYYFLHKGTVEDEIITILNDKKFASDLVLSDEAMFRRMIAKREEKSSK